MMTPTLHCRAKGTSGVSMSLPEGAELFHAISVFGVQGPWYTVGWRMSVAIERAFGRARLIDCIADNRLLLPTFNETVRASQLALSIWPDSLASAFLP
jgi:hypothetical protein